jgi:hypothetical protein
MTQKSTGLMRLSRHIQIGGWVALGAGVLSYAQYFIDRPVDLPPDMGIVIGSAAILIIGSITVATASCLKELEARLDRIEGSRSASESRLGETDSGELE